MTQNKFKNLLLLWIISFSNSPNNLWPVILNYMTSY